MELRGQLQAFAIFALPNRIECRQEMFAKSCCCLVGTCLKHVAPNCLIFDCSLTWPWYSIMEITTALMMMVREWVWLGKLTMKENKESHFASLPIKRQVVGWLLQLSIGKYHLRKGRKQDFFKIYFWDVWQSGLIFFELLWQKSFTTFVFLQFAIGMVIVTIERLLEALCKCIQAQNRGQYYNVTKPPYATVFMMMMNKEALPIYWHATRR